jgi:hypothetical protein
VIAERGVRHGHVVFVPTEPAAHDHPHTHGRARRRIPSSAGR